MAIGQSFLLVTPIQMAAMTSSVFNGGHIYRPQTTQWVGDSESEKVYAFTPKRVGKLNISEKNLEIVRNALIGVVNEEHGTGSGARIIFLK